MKTITTSIKSFKSILMAFVLFTGLTANAQNCNASFTYAVGQNGTVSFSSTCTNTTNLTQIFWTFGPYFSPSFANGPTAVSTNTSSSYNYVCIYASDSLNNSYCSYCDSIMLNQNPCAANVSVALFPDSVALNWYGNATYDQNVIGATWSWGDGSFSNGLYPSHTYSAAGWYNVCVTETVSCGATASACVNSFLNKSSEQNAMVTLRIRNPNPITAGIKNNKAESINAVVLYPNPTSDNAYFSFSSKRSGEVKVTVYDIMGSKLSEKTEKLNEGENKIEIESKNYSKGFYMVSLNDGNVQKTVRLVKD